jgi:GTP-binding protein
MGVKELIDYTAAQLHDLPPVITFEPEYVEKIDVPETCDDLKIENHGGLWFIEGQWIEQLMGSINFSDYESRMYFDRVLRTCGLFERLEKMGVQEGDTISIYDLEFEYRY